MAKVPCLGRSPRRRGIARGRVGGADHILVRIDSARHYLHNTTAEALRDDLAAILDSPAPPRSAAVRIHGTPHNLPLAGARALHGVLAERIESWTAARDEQLPGMFGPGGPAPMKVGYARVSTRAQGDSLDTQEATLREHGCERVFRDTVSGARSSRPGLDDALDFNVRRRRAGRDPPGSAGSHRRRHPADDRGAKPARRPGGHAQARARHSDQGGQAHDRDHAAPGRVRARLADRAHPRGVGRRPGTGHEGGRPPSISEKKRAALVKAVEGGESVAEAAELLGISRAHAYRIVKAEAGRDTT